MTTLSIEKEGTKFNFWFRGGLSESFITINIDEEYEKFVWTHWSNLSTELEIRLCEEGLEREYAIPRLIESDDVKNAGKMISDYMQAKKKLLNGFRDAEFNNFSK